MRFCPKCRGEFQDWAEVCHVCHVPLVDRLPAVQHKQPSPDKPTPISGDIITIARFSHPQEAHIFSSKLQSAGIPSFVADEYVVTMNWLYSNAIGGVRLQVLKSDAAEARSILGLSQSKTAVVEYTGECCPKCGSSDTHYETFSDLTTLLLALCVLMLSVFAFAFLKRRWKCNACGYQWRNGEKTS
jgi:hypothetical protein